MSKRGPTQARTWQPMTRCVVIPNPETPLRAEPEMWKNDRYVVIVRRLAVDDAGNVIPDATLVDGGGTGPVAQLSIRRADRKAARDWRDFQRIKNDIAGRDVEAVELYPAEDRVVDTANQYHLWCSAPGERIGIGWQKGVRNDDASSSSTAKQRPGSEET